MGPRIIGSYRITGHLGIVGIAAGHNLGICFNENDTSKVGSITIVGRVNQICDTGQYPFGVTAGLDGNMLFCVGFDNAIGRVHLR
jgi:hypothetical protein